MKWLDNALILFEKTQFEFDAIARGCLSEASAAANNMDVFTLVKNGRAALKDVVPQSVLALGGTMGMHGIPTVLLIIYGGVMDQVSPFNETDTLFEK